MIAKGAYIIVGDSDLRDMYIAECLETNRNEHVVNTLVRVLYMLRYPIQHAIIHTDVAHENPPFTPDVPCKLKFIGHAGRHDIAMAQDIGYDASFAKAHAVALEAVENRVRLSQERPGNRHIKTDPEELNILVRHGQGDIKGARSCLVRMKR